MAKRKTSGWVIGCGVGCLVLLVLGIALFAGGALWVRNTMGGFREAVEAREALEERFGEAGDYTPAADGSIAPVRLEAFLAVRQATAASRQRIRAAFEALPMSEEEAEALDRKPFFEKMTSVAGITSSALGLASSIGDFYRARNTAFAEHQMGLGEYSYIYVLAYYSWLGKSPEDGPGDDDIDADFGRSFRRVRRDLISQLENQLAAVAGSGAEVAPSKSGRELETEIAAMRDDARRLPWEDGLPPAIEDSLRPFRDRLEAAYDPVTNPFELARMEQRGGFSVEAR